MTWLIKREENLSLFIGTEIELRKYIAGLHDCYDESRFTVWPIDDSKKKMFTFRTVVEET